MSDQDYPTTEPVPPQDASDSNTDAHCPVCGATLIHEKCKVICRSPTCTYRIVFNCAEF